MKYIEKYLKDIIKVKPLGKLTTEEDELDGISGEMVYIDGKCSNIFISHIDYANWLEKQDEQNPYSGVSFKYNGHTWGMCARDNGVEILMDSELKAFISLDKSFIYPVTPIPSFKAYDMTYNPVDKFEPKSHEGEQKSDSFCRENCKGFKETGKCFADGDCKAKREAESTNKVEPKFKVGDWIVFNGLTLYIKEVVKGCYRTKSTSGIAITHSWNIDNFARLWTIEDAKEGDILAFDDETIVIFKDLYNRTSFHSYCHIEDGVFNISKDDMPDWWEGEGFYPATRKQRDILFSKMKKAGYEWYINKKELRKKE